MQERLLPNGFRETIETMNIKSYDEFSERVRFFFDMDGVLADLDGGLESSSFYPELERRRNNLVRYIQKKYEKRCKNFNEADFFMKSHSDDPEGKKLNNESKKILYKIIDAKNFYANLDVFSGSIEMMKHAQELTGYLPDVLSSPAQSKWCKGEKIEWLKKNFDGLYKNAYIVEDKTDYALSKKCILIDDREKITNEFLKAGGSVILHENPDDTMKKMTNMFHKFEKK